MLEERKSGDGDIMFLQTYRGELVRRVAEPTEKSIARITQSGNEVHEEPYGAVIGRIEGVEIDSFEYEGKTLRTLSIRLIDDASSQRAKLDLGFTSSQASAFLRCSPNIDFTKPVKIRCGDYDGRYWLVVEQKGKTGEWERVPFYFTKEDRKGLPEWKEIVVNGEKKWDRTDELAYFTKMVPAIDKKCLELDDSTSQVLADSDPLNDPDIAKNIVPGSEEAEAPVLDDDDIPF